MYGAEPRYNDLRYNDGNVVDRAQDIPVVTIKSIPQTTENANILYNKTNFYYINNNNKLFLTCFKYIEGWRILWIVHLLIHLMTKKILLDNVQ